MTDTYIKVRDTLRQVVQEMGEDYLYTPKECSYTDANGAPSCGVGHVIGALSPKALERVHAWEWGNGPAKQDSPWSSAIRSPTLALRLSIHGLGDVMNDAASMELLAVFQQRQDNRETWGEALEAAEAAAEAVLDRLGGY